MRALSCCLAGLLCLVAAQARAGDSAFNVLDAYGRAAGQERLNTPEDEVAWLRENQLTHGELDDFPQAAIVLHRVNVEAYLAALGFAGFYTSFAYGFTDPGLVYLVRKPGTTPFAVARGLPGAGGITTQAAELQAMGARSIIHVGTCGLLSAELPWGQLIVSTGSYRDGAAFLLEAGDGGPIARPDADLSDRIERTIARDRLSHARALGVTLPIYYFQPASLLRDLLAIGGPDKPSFVEMEQAPLFSLARLMKVRAASIVVASDRLENRDGRLKQGFLNGDLDALELSAFREAVRALAGTGN